MTQTTADTIYQQYLDVATRLFWSKQWDDLAGLIVLPGDIHSPNGTYHVSTQSELIETFRTQHESLQRNGATEFHRICLRAEFDKHARHSITGVHKTYALNGGGYVVPPYENTMALTLEDGTWKANGIRSSVPNEVLSLHPLGSDLQADLNSGDAAR